MQKPQPEVEGAAEAFDRLRPRLTRIAYRMLGSVSEAEDMVQEAYLRWHGADRAAVREPAAFLARTVTRLCLDHLKSARARRESYVGMWLPEPLVDDAPAPDEGDPDELSLVLMMALERLSPLERAAFLLHDVFDLPFEEVSAAIGRDPATCRQLASRARAHVRTDRPRFRLDAQQGEDIARAFFTAAYSGDVEGLQKLLAQEVVSYADGGGKRPAFPEPILGQEKVVRMFAMLAEKGGPEPPRFIRFAMIDGLPGYLAVDRHGVFHTTALEVMDGRIKAIFTMRNPDKLRHLEAMGEG
ncbi:sigma-70 family RNA polymerase sigma factor [Aquabacter sp. CN5-332]